MASVVFRYAEGTNPNGSMNDIAGIMNEKGNVLGLMPHPEDLIEAGAWRHRRAGRCSKARSASAPAA